jgi:hypothetical protein
MSWAMWSYAVTLFLSPKISALSTMAVALLSLCITVRAYRDISLIFVIRNETKIHNLGKHSKTRIYKERNRFQ